jgi:release factor glutamine methyltransferase
VRVTVLEAIQKSTEFLGKKNVESPRLQTELLLAHLLKLPRMQLYLNFDRELTAAETAALREWVKRRGQREPLQHIVGSSSFCGIEISVSRQALIPRPETELLAEMGWQFLQALERGAEGSGGRQAGDLTALDFGTGTGCLAIVVAMKCPRVRITALEISAEALALAKENAAEHCVAGRINFVHGNGLAALGSGAEAGPGGPPSFDLVLSNPPYIPAAEIGTLEPEVRDFDPRLALDGGADGLDFYRALAAQAKKHLKPHGKIMLEFGDGQADAIGKILADEKWIVEAIREDYSQRARIIVAKLSSS